MAPTAPSYPPPSHLRGWAVGQDFDVPVQDGSGVAQSLNAMNAAEQQEVLQSLYEVHTAHAMVEMSSAHANRVHRMMADGKEADLVSAERRPRGAKTRGGKKIQLRRIQHALQMLGAVFVPQQQDEQKQEHEQKAEAEQEQKQEHEPGQEQEDGQTQEHEHDMDPLLAAVLATTQ